MEINKTTISKEGVFLFGFFIALSSALAAWVFDAWWIAAVPIFMGLALFALKDLFLLYALLFICLPFSTEIDIVSGMVLDLPAEPIMAVFLFLSLIWLLLNKRPWGHIILHPVTLLLFFHLSWMTLTSFSSVDKLVSFKFLLAKYWYVAAFYVSSWFFIRHKKDLKTLIWCLYLPLVFIVIWVLVRQAFQGFEFDDVNVAVQPFFRNHVDYASILVLSYPLIWISYRWYPKGSWQRILILTGLVLIPVGIYFSYTRAAIGILLLYPVIYWILRMKGVHYVLIAAVLFIVGTAVYYISDKEYVSLAPNYERTIYHDEFGNLLEATYKMEDLSTMERLYRWVAGGHMLMDRPWLGTGPGTFYPTYKAYTVSAFKTYTSHNPEKSGVHNYYLMTATDQGLIGLGIFLVFIFFSLLFIQYTYHQNHRDRDQRLLIAGLFCMICGILILNTINDMMENIKAGSLFFFGLALIAMVSRNYEISPPIKERP